METHFARYVTKWQHWYAGDSVRKWWGPLAVAVLLGGGHLANHRVGYRVPLPHVLFGSIFGLVNFYAFRWVWAPKERRQWAKRGLVLAALYAFALAVAIVWPTYVLLRALSGGT